MKKRFVLGDMSEILRGYEGKWVALSMKDEQIVISGSGVTINEAIEKAWKNGVNDPTLMKAPDLCAYIL